MRDYEHIKFLQKLENVKRDRKSLDTSELENDFLRFSSYSSGGLRAILPGLYKLEGEQIGQMEKVLKSLEYNVKVPESIDITGKFDISSIDDSIVIFSPKQLEASHLSRTNSYLNPLIEKIYSEGDKLIKDFSVPSVLFGRLAAKRGDLDLKDIHLFPERFIPGPYSLSVNLDTPSKDVLNFKRFLYSMREFKKSPKDNILGHKRVEELTNRAIALRENLGALTRYAVPRKQVFKALVNECVVRYKDGQDVFYLYSPEKNKNIAVVFGKTPLEELNQDSLTVLRGSEHEASLSKLLEFRFFEPSEAVLESRLTDMEEIYKNISRAEGQLITEKSKNFAALMDGLKNAKTYLGNVVNKDKRIEFLKEQTPALTEFMVCPKDNNPVLHELLARLSWNKNLRHYNSTNRFIAEFSASDNEKKKEVLKQVASSILFSNQQNNDVNLWLYKNYKEFCESNEINFQVA